MHFGDRNEESDKVSEGKKSEVKVVRKKGKEEKAAKTGTTETSVEAATETDTTKVPEEKKEKAAETDKEKVKAPAETDKEKVKASTETNTTEPSEEPVPVISTNTTDTVVAEDETISPTNACNDTAAKLIEKITTISK